MTHLNNRWARTCAMATLAATTAACTSLNTGADYRPLVDGGDLSHYETDLVQCQALARQRQYINDDTRADAAIGALIGAIAGSDGDRGDIIGGAIAGGMVGAGSKAYEVKDERKRIVINCMKGRGYKTVE